MQDWDRVWQDFAKLQLSILSVLYYAQVIPYGMHGMGDGFHIKMDSMEWGWTP